MGSSSPARANRIRFRHDRIREVVLDRMSQQHRDALRLRLARRLAARPELFAVAAQQYLPVTDAVREPQERRVVIDLFRRGAEQAKILSNYPVAERYFASAVALADADDTSTLIELQTGRHEALYSVARLDEADEVYRAIERLSPNDPGAPPASHPRAGEQPDQPQPATGGAQPRHRPAAGARLRRTDARAHSASRSTAASRRCTDGS